MTSRSRRRGSTTVVLRMRLPTGSLNRGGAARSRRSVEGLRTVRVAETRCGLLCRCRRAGELEPDVGGALVDAPAAGERLDDREPASADILRTALAHLKLEAAALVDDLAVDLVPVD